MIPCTCTTSRFRFKLLDALSLLNISSHFTSLWDWIVHIVYLPGGRLWTIKVLYLVDAAVSVAWPVLTWGYDTLQWLSGTNLFKFPWSRKNTVNICTDCTNWVCLTNRSDWVCDLFDRNCLAKGTLYWSLQNCVDFVVVLGACAFFLNWYLEI